MPAWLIVFLCAAGTVALFVVGMSLTLMIKGHYIDSEISTNKNMQKLGIKCAVQESREDSGEADCANAGCSGSCSACDIEQELIAESMAPDTSGAASDGRKTHPDASREKHAEKS